MLDYGVIGDGVVDDTSKIQSVVNLDKNTFFPAGNYRVEGNKGINLKSNRTYFGDGDGDGDGTIFSMFETSLAQVQYLAIFNCWNSVSSLTLSNVIIKDMRMTTINPSAFVNTYSGGIVVYNADKCVIDNVTFDNFRASGIFIYGESLLTQSKNIVVKNCYFDNWDPTLNATQSFGAVHLGSHSTGCTVENNIILCKVAHGIALYDGYTGGVSIKHNM